MLSLFPIHLLNNWIQPKNQALHQVVEDSLEETFPLQLSFIIQEYLCVQVVLGGLSVEDRPALIQYIRALGSLGRVELEVWHMDLFSRRLLDSNGITDEEFARWFYPLHPAVIYVWLHL